MNTHHRLKLLALVLMTLDHLGAYFYPDQLWLRALGRLCVPIWFFLVGHALRYPLRPTLVLWAVLMMLVDMWLGAGAWPLNILVTILLVRGWLQQVEKRDWLRRYPGAMMAALLLLVLPTSHFLQYGTLGALYGLMGYAVRSGQMNGWRGYSVAVVAYLAYVGLQLIRFDFTLAQQVLVVFGTGAITYTMARFEHRPLVMGTRGARLAAPAVWLARHSMEYYVLHRTAFACIAWAMGYVVFAWEW